MRTLRLFPVLLLALAAGLLFYGWQGMPSESTHSTPTPSRSSEIYEKAKSPQVYATNIDSSEWGRRLTARRGAEDLQSIVETFKESGNCLQYFVALYDIGGIKRDKRLDDLSQETPATLDGLDASLAGLSSVVEQTKDFCSGANEESVARAYMVSVLKAALMGDADAQSCFVVSGAGAPSPETMRSGRYAKYLEDRYLKHASALTQRALELYDPHVAGHALHRYVASAPVHPSKLDTVPFPDPYLTWRAARLASLRALPEQRSNLEDNLVSFEKLNLLSPNEIKRADDWAKATYLRDFSSEPPINLSRFGTCNSLKEATP